MQQPKPLGPKRRLDDDVATFDMAELTQPLPEGVDG
jgi:hypothetical protein